MKVFEFHFNPRQKEQIFDTFCFAPQNKKERGLGCLYAAGILKNALPQNFSLLEKTVEILQKNYYETGTAATTDENFRQALRAANEFLQNEFSKENTGWLGNFNLAVFSLDKKLSLRFSRLGTLGSFLLKKNEIIDIGKSLAPNNVSPENSSFQNVLSATLAESDKLLFFNPEIFDALQKEKTLEELTRAGKKEIKAIFQTRKKTFKKLFGFCFLIFAEKERFLRRVFDFLRFNLRKTKPVPPPQLKPKRIKLNNVFGVVQKPGLALVSRLGWQRLKTGLLSLLLLALLLLLGYLIF